jgi:signal transduction histidine kinase
MWNPRLSEETNTTLSRYLPEKKGISTTLHQQVKITTTSLPLALTRDSRVEQILLHLLPTPERSKGENQEKELLLAFRKAAERLKQLAKLREVTRQITSYVHEQDGLQRILHRIVESINELVDEDAISIIYLYEEDHRDKWRLYKNNRADPSSPSVDKKVEDQIARYASFIAAKYPLPPSLANIQVIPHQDYGRLTAILPLIFGGKVVGVLSIELQKHRSSVEELAELLELFAEQAAIAIETARLIENLQRLNQQIADQQELVTRAMIASDFVHQINNLAGTIPIRVNMIKDSLPLDKPDYKRVYKHLDSIASEARDLLSAANELKRKPEQEDMDIALLLREMRNNVKIQYPHVAVEYEQPSNLHCVRAIDAQLRYAIWNVVINAVEAMPNGGRLTLHANDYDKEQEQWVKIEIKDTGQGLTIDMKNIFSLSYTTKGLGHGYGLWRTKNVIENLGGSIVLESEPLVGATFTILLPAVEPSL